MNPWPFSDPPNVAVFTSKTVVSGDAWICYVSHDEEDGAWQFHPPGDLTPEEEAAVVGLGTMLQIDPSIGELYNLPPGWCAWREAKDAEWQRMKKQEDR